MILLRKSVTAGKHRVSGVLPYGALQHSRGKATDYAGLLQKTSQRLKPPQQTPVSPTMNCTFLWVLTLIYRSTGLLHLLLTSVTQVLYVLLKCCPLDNYRCICRNKLCP